MTKLRLVAGAILTAAILGTGALTAPSASAQRPTDCIKLFNKAEMYYRVWELLVATGYGQTQTANQVLDTFYGYADAYADCSD